MRKTLNSTRRRRLINSAQHNDPELFAYGTCTDRGFGLRSICGQLSSAAGSGTIIGQHPLKPPVWSQQGSEGLPQGFRHHKGTGFHKVGLEQLACC